MATYVIGAVGTALGGPLGGIIGSLAGGFVDRLASRALTPSTKTTTNSVGPRLTELAVTGSVEGTVIPRLIGRSRLGGEVIWTTTFKEVATTSTQNETAGRGKGGGGKQTTTTTTTTYKYYLSFAVAFCEGNTMAQLGRIWIDSDEADLEGITYRFYSGSETQSPDPLIQSIEGVANTPAYRGVCYIVFEDLPLEDYGNRMPQITAEIICPLDTADPYDLSNLARAYTLIPATGEFAYGTQDYFDNQGYYDSWHSQYVITAVKDQNHHTNLGSTWTDIGRSLALLNSFSKNNTGINFVVSWFFDDARAGNCLLRPKVESYQRNIAPADWAVATYTRSTAPLVSYDADNRPVFGGTPSDSSVIDAVDLMISQSKRVMFYPFLLGDITASNTLPDPYSNNAASIGQAAYPWRGRITCSPAIGFVGSPDKTATATTQINAFFDQYDVMVLHYANLLKNKALHAFIIGSELVGLTTVRGAAGSFPAVDRLVTLAAAVKAVFVGAGNSSVKISYAADWSEYHSYRPNDGSNDVLFNLDPLWSSANIDFVGIDNYLPISDWRDGSAHLDYDGTNGPVSVYDHAYLESNIEGGELFDWYYASSADRDSQTRTTISDGAYSKPWVFRQKDIRSWWLNSHYNRPNGVESGSPTAWVPQSKPIYFTEFGCPAIDKGSNQPNVFYDPKSSESAFPYYSTGDQDDLMQRVYLEVVLKYWYNNSPISSVYGDLMLSIDNMFIWTWDARPFPAFPAKTDVWGDGALWEKGHWLTGRIESAVLARLVAYICERVGLTSSQYDVSGLYGQSGGLIRGLYINNSTTEREILESLARFYLFNGFESEGKLKFILNTNVKTTSINIDDFVVSEDQTYAVSITRKQETELLRTVQISYLDELNDFQPASIDGHRSSGTALQTVSYTFPIVADARYARSLATIMIYASYQARESGEFSLPLSKLAIEVGDGLNIPVSSGRVISVRVDQIDRNDKLDMQFSGFDATAMIPASITTDLALPSAAPVFGAVILEFMDLPLLYPEELSHHAPRLAAYSEPWPGSVNLMLSDGFGGFIDLQNIPDRAIVGETTSAFYPGPVYDIWDMGNTLDVVLYSGTLTSLSKEQLLASSIANTLAVRNMASGTWEIIQFATATLLAPGQYRLSTLLRGLLDTRDGQANPLPAGARIVQLAPGVIHPLNVTKDQAVLPLSYRWGPAPNDPAGFTYVTGTRFGTLRGLRPYAPTDVTLVKNSSTNDLVLTWKRRNRLGGDGWAQTEVPMSETYEGYILTILSGPGGLVKRVEWVNGPVVDGTDSSPMYVYSAVNQIADFGLYQTSLYIELAQYGASYGNTGGVFASWVYTSGAY
jgi:hypothetical protein